VNCSDIQARLSAYHDSELSNDEAAEVSAHLSCCPTCAADLASFEQLSGLSRKLTDPPVPVHLWDELQSKLRHGVGGSRASNTSDSKGRPVRLLAISATVLVAIGIGVVGYRSWNTANVHHHLEDNFTNFLNEFESRPDNAQQVLLASYEGRSTSLPEATDAIGYQPVAATRLPAGCTIDKVYVLKMPCCTCAEITCRNENGHHLAIFEHDIDQPVWFGDRPTINCICSNVPTTVVQMGSKLAATWKEGKRYITIVGANSLEEVTEFVDHLSRG
jgi:hypothetical protein